MYILEIAMRVAKWGNSLAVRLPAAVVEALELQEGDDIEVRLTGDRTLEVAKTPTAAERLERLRRLRGRMPKGYRFTRADAYER
jgi:antitoxin MazE